ncbi:MAG: hypothetical protein KDA78_03780 [Planctomycetaceae bacterium]|nr:hypothetical protein [Planctomycetaceae bacterium]
MIIYRIKQSATFRDYAQCTITGNWRITREKQCCGEYLSELTPPTIAQWIPGSDTLGDFTWSGMIPLCQNRVKDFLKNNGFHCTFSPVRFEQYDGHAGRSVKNLPLVEHPYKGPLFYRVKAKDLLIPNTERTPRHLFRTCGRCGKNIYKAMTSDIHIDSCNWKGEGIFRFKENPRSQHMFVTEEAKHSFEQAEFSNITFIEAGRIV